MAESELSAYLKDLGRHPVLTKETQLRHCYRIHRWVNWPEGKQAAPHSVSRAGKRSMDVMVRTNLRLVVSVAKKFHRRGTEMSDLIQEGNLGLIRGLELFDPTRGYTVSTYVYWWIRQGVSRSIQSSCRTIRLPVQVGECFAKAQKFIEVYTVSQGTPPTTEMVADHVNMTPEKMTALFDAVDRTSIMSLDTGAPSPDTNFMDIIPCPRQLPEDYVQQLEDDENVSYLLAGLSGETRIVAERTFLDHHRVKDVGADLDLSTHKVKKLQAEAVEALQPRVRVLTALSA